MGENIWTSRHIAKIHSVQRTVEANTHIFKCAHTEHTHICINNTLEFVDVAQTMRAIHGLYGGKTL